MDKENNLEVIDNFVEKQIKRGAFPGAVLLIGTREKTLYFKAYGYSKLFPERNLMTKDTLFDMASVTKPVATATSIMVLLERGEIRLDDSVKYFIPSFQGELKDEVTIRHLLTHTSGLPPWLPLYSICSSREEVYRYVSSSVKLQYKPGERVIYSDLNFILLGYIIERVSGLRLDEFSSKNIFKRLNMRNTLFNPPKGLKEKAAATEYCSYRKRILQGEVHDENAYRMNGISGHAGLFSTAKDLAIFARMMLNKGRYANVKVLSSRSVEEMTKDQTIGLNQRRGLGWDLKNKYCSCGDLFTEKAYGHTGFTGTSIWIDPELNLFVIFLTNRVHPTRSNTAIISIRPRLHNIIVATLF